MRKGFTITEMAVVTGLVGVLTALALPALSKAREKGRDVICKAQLHEWGNLMEGYRMNNKNEWYLRVPNRNGQPTQAFYREVQEKFDMPTPQEVEGEWTCIKPFWCPSMPREYRNVARGRSYEYFPLMFSDGLFPEVMKYFNGRGETPLGTAGMPLWLLKDDNAWHIKRENAYFNDGSVKGQEQ